MKVASVTVTSNREGIIEDAILSVRDWVDAAVVVDLGITDGTLDIITRVMGEVGKPVYVTAMDPDSSSCGEWRNAGMKLAQEAGFDWCITLDTDERIQAPSDIRSILAKATADVFMCDDQQRRYPKERLFKLPTVNWFKGHHHERIPNLGNIVYLETLTFSELPKTPEAMLKVCEGLVVGKLAELEEDPTDARNWYYLGDAYAALNRNEEAIAPLLKCVELSKWDAECAWACLRAALCMRKMNDRWKAIQQCALGLTYHPGYSELAWLAAVCCMESGQLQHAIYWARMSIINGKTHINVHHGFHQHPFGVWEGPYEIMRDAYKLMGNEEESKVWGAKAEQVTLREVAA